MTMKRKNKIFMLMAIAILAISTTSCGIEKETFEGMNLDLKMVKEQVESKITIASTSTSKPVSESKTNKSEKTENPSSASQQTTESSSQPEEPKKTQNSSFSSTSKPKPQPEKTDKPQNSSPTPTPKPKPQPEEPDKPQNPSPAPTPKPEPTPEKPAEPEKKPILITHYVCAACGYDSTDKDPFMDHVVEHALKGEDNGYGTYTEEVWE